MVSVIQPLFAIMKARSILRFIICLAIPVLVGGLSGYLTSGAIANWYADLIKPSFNPPNYLFGPVWTTLYLLMGVSLYMVWHTEPSKTRTRAVLVFYIQLLLNFWWSIFFFRFQRPDIALIEIVVLWVSILYMIITFYKLKPWAAFLQIPYLLWVTFAAILNQAIWWLNR